MKIFNLRNEVYRACSPDLHFEIRRVKQFVESFTEPIVLDETWISFIGEEFEKRVKEKSLRKKAEEALFSLYKQSFISEKVGYIKFPKIKAIEFWHLPSQKPEISEGLLTTLYTNIKRGNLTYHGIEQYAPSNPLTDKLDEIYWRYLGRLGTYVPIYAAICFSTPEDVVQYPREEEIKMMSEMFKVKEREIMPLIKARTLNHMHFLGIRIRPQTSLWGKWWLKRNIFNRFLNKGS